MDLELIMVAAAQGIENSIRREANARKTGKLTADELRRIDLCRVVAQLPKFPDRFLADLAEQFEQLDPDPHLRVCVIKQEKP